MSTACGPCLRRSWLLRELAGHLDAVRGEIDEVLALSDHALIAAVGGRRRRQLERRLARARDDPVRQALGGAGVRPVCRCADSYPSRLLDLAAPPTVLFIAAERGAEEWLAEEPIAIVGTRRASSYGLEVARSLARGVAAAGMTVVSGMALGIDSAVHEGALAAAGSVHEGAVATAGATVAVLPGPAGEPYPRSRRRLHRQVVRAGAAISELPAGTPVRRWTLIARNRIIAGLSAATVVVEAPAGSGALLTAAVARKLGRAVGAVPGRVTTPQAGGTNELLAGGAFVVRGPQDVLDAVYGIGVRAAAGELRPPLSAEAREVLRAVADGADSADALAAAERAPDTSLAALAWLELTGYLRREPGGRFTVIP